MTENHITSTIKNLLSSYSFYQLYLWLAGTAVVPENQDKPMRFEVIMACLLSIPAHKFKNKKLTYKAFCKLIANIDDLIYPIVCQQEDYHPYPQMKKIPLFTSEGVRYFIYGTYEYPYLMWKRIIDLYYPFLKSINSPICQTVSKILLFQTRLIEVFEKYKLTDVNQCNIFIPTAEILNEIGGFFIVDEYEDYARICRVGELSRHKNLINYANNGEMYNILYIKDKNKKYFWLPLDHYDGVIYAIENAIYTDDILESELTFSAKQYLFEYIFSSGRINNRINNILSLTKNNLAESIDHIAKVDEQNILLFKYVALYNEQDKKTAIDDCIGNLKSTIAKIREQELVLFEDELGNCHGVPKVEYWGIVVINIFQTNCLSIQMGKEDNIFFCQFDDMCYFLDHITSFCELLQFLLDEQQILKHGCISLDAISRFDVYFDNKGFIHSGMPLMLCFDPHLGSIKVFETIYEQMHNTIHERAYYLLENKYGIVRKQIAGDGFDICDRISGAGGMGIVISDILFFIRFPWADARYAPKDEVDICCNILAPLILDYVSKLGKHVIDLCKKYSGQNLPALFRIDLIPKAIAKKTPSFIDIIPEISEQNPIVTKGILKSTRGFVGLVYDIDLLPEFFSSFSDNSAEKIIISQILATIISTVTEENYEQSLVHASNIWMKLIGKQRKGYSMDYVQIIDPMMKEYPLPLKLDTIEQKHVQKEISAFLLTDEIHPGIYQFDEAKEICNSIVAFLWNKLVFDLSMYQKTCLTYIYRELELVFYYRDNLKKSAGLKANNRNDYNIAEKFKEESLEAQQLQDAISYLFHVFYSLGEYGDRHITTYDWKKCLALGWWINEISYISDAIHFDTANFELLINDLYEISLNYKRSKYNYLEFQDKQASFIINYENQRLQSQALHNAKVKQTEPKDGLDDNCWVDIINNAFDKDLGFSFSLVQLIESSLLEISSKEMDFPILTFRSKSDLCDMVYTLLVEAGKNYPRNTISLCIDFLMSVPCESSRTILPSKLKTYKKRITISPIINNGQNLAYGKQIVDVSKRVLFNYLYAGVPPFDLSKYPNIKQALDDVHKIRDKELENRIFYIACRVLGENMTMKNIKNFQCLSLHLEKSPKCGEIDLLAINQETQTVFVIDAKNQHNEKTPSGIHRESKRFFGDNGHVDQLEKKTKYIEAHLQLVLEHFNISSNDNWKVVNAFVSDKMFISGFLEGNGIAFIDISELEQFLKKGKV